jgi:hypothetical protein
MSPDDRAERRAARETIRSYHEEELRLLLEPVRDALGRLDTGEFDAFEVDELIHRYERSARELWKFCGQTDRGEREAFGTMSGRTRSVVSQRGVHVPRSPRG